MSLENIKELMQKALSELEVIKAMVVATDETVSAMSLRSERKPIQAWNGEPRHDLSGGDGPSYIVGWVPPKERILEVIRKTGNDGLAATALARKTQLVDGGERRRLLMELVAERKIEWFRKATPGKPSDMYRYIAGAGESDSGTTEKTSGT